MNFVRTKDELLEQVSLAVEQIQKLYRFGNDVIGDCEEVSLLCKCVDDILHHGLKEGLISWAMEPSVWPLLEKITCMEDIQQIKSLHLKTDKEKCGAWIKMAVNLNLLGSYVSALHQDNSLLSHYYDYAFLRDPVLTGTVESLLNYGIANFNFQITVDVKRMARVSDKAQEQEVPAKDYDSYGQETKLNGDVAVGAAINVSRESSSKKKRKKKVHSVVISNLGDDNSYDEHSGELVNGSFESLKESEEIIASTAELDRVEGKDGQVDADCGQDTTQHDRDNVVHDQDDSPDEKVSLDSIKMKDEQNEITKDRDASRSQEINREHGGDVGINDGNDGHQGTAITCDSYEVETSGSISKTEKMISRNSLPREQDVPETARNEFSSESDLLLESSPSIENCDLDKLEPNIEQKQLTDVEKTDSRENADSNSRTRLSEDCEKKSEVTDSGFRTQADKNPDSESRIPEPDSSTSITRLSTDSEKKGYSKIQPDKNAYSESRISEHDSSTSSEKRSEMTDSGCSIGYSNRVAKSQRNESHMEKHSAPNSPLMYRVRKIENPEFVSSSYSSAYSDVTDASYDDCDLNSIPGIHPHRLSTSSVKSGSYDEPRRGSVSFDENGFPVFDSSHFTDSASRTSSIDGSSGRFLETSNDWDMFDDLLNIEEEHFAGPENFAGLTTSEELEIAIDHYKKMIKLKKSSERDELVKKLIKLRLRLQQEREEVPVSHPQIRNVLSHHFQKEVDSSGPKTYCDQCGKIIWVLWQSLFTCNDCGYHSHRKCLDHIQRPCPTKNLNTLSFILDICPDTGLDAQQYRCAECRREIALSKDGVSEARLCDYTGQYFCEHCHWNDHVSIPARVVHNWDFSQYKVCRQTKQLLELMKIKPLLNLQEINPMLFRYVEELREVGNLRGDILIMKKYFLSCRDALETKLLLQLKKRQHFVDSTEGYSFQDLLDLNNDVLLPEISKVHALFLAHIKADCELCRARGFICEVCRDSSDIIFAFDPHVVKCKNCSSVYHKICYKPDNCPKCRRKKRVTEDTEHDTNDT